MAGQLGIVFWRLIKKLQLCHADPFASHSERSEESPHLGQGKLPEPSRSVLKLTMYVLRGVYPEARKSRFFFRHRGIRMTGHEGPACRRPPRRAGRSVGDELRFTPGFRKAMLEIPACSYPPQRLGWLYPLVSCRSPDRRHHYAKAVSVN